MDTWGISGPDFLKLYAVLIAAPIVVGLGWRLIQTARTSAGTPASLTVHHLAYLAGGRRRVAESAVARLLAAKRLRMSSTGKITVIVGPALTDKTERVVIGVAGNSRLPKLVRKLGPHISKLNAELAAAGLAVPEAAVRRRRVGVVLLSVVVFLFGCVRYSYGVSHDKPVGWLFLENVGALVMIIILLRWRRRDTALATVAGRRVLRRAKAGQRTGGSTPQDRAAMVLFGAGAAGAVALGGMALYPDPAVQSALAYVPASASGGGGSSCGGSSSCSSGSSCGGGGGSSCGGGGGCGG